MKGRMKERMKRMQSKKSEREICVCEKSPIEQIKPGPPVFVRLVYTTADVQVR